MVSLAQAQHLVQLVREVHDGTAGFITQARPREVPGSILAREHASLSPPTLIEAVRGQGHLLVESAADHLMAFVRLVTEPVQTLAPFTCVRGTLEASALAAWLFDPIIDARARVARSLALRYQGLEQQLWFVEVVGTAEQVEGVRRRFDHLEAEAGKLGLQPVKNTKGKRVGVAHPMPKMIKLIAEALRMDQEYRLLSAVAHGHHWTTAQLGFKRLTDDHSPELAALAKGLSPIAVAYLCRTASQAFGSAIVREARVSGWDAEQLSKLICSGFTAAGLDLQLA